MRILRFPATIKLDLPDRLRQALDLILERRPSIRNDRALLLRVFGEGIAAILQTEKSAREDPEGPSVADRMDERLREMAADVEDCPELNTNGSLRPFPKITRRYKDPTKRHVESYVATVIPRQVQDRLQLFLDTNPETDLESFLATLIGVGLAQVEKDPKILHPNPADLFDRAESKNPVTAASREQHVEEFTLDFPRTLRLDLSGELRRQLRDLANRVPHASDERLAVNVLERGIEAMMTDDGVVQPVAATASITGARHEECVKDLSLEDRLRKKLTRFLAAHPDAMSKERARKLLAGLSPSLSRASRAE